MTVRRIFQEEHNLFRSTFRKYIQKKIIPNYMQWEKNGQVPREMWLDAGRSGLLCPTAKKEFGGVEADLLYSIIIAEELYYHGTPGFYISLHNDIVFQKLVLPSFPNFLLPFGMVCQLSPYLSVVL